MPRDKDILSPFLQTIEPYESRVTICRNFRLLVDISNANFL